MHTKQIDAVLELAKTLNFNRAAEKLFVSQPTLSYEIKTFEEEIGFRLFDRSGKGAVLTPAGQQFCLELKDIRDRLKKAVEQGQNFSTRFSDSITIGIPTRSMLLNLPQVMIKFAAKYPDISIVPQFVDFYNTSTFLSGQQDLLVAMDFEMKHIPDVKVFPLYKSGISLIVRPDDPLAKKKVIMTEDLTDRTLMVGGGSPPALQRVQQRAVHTQKLRTFNSPNHETTLTNIAARKGICLAPQFFDDKSQEFVWIPFSCDEHFKIVVSAHSNDKRDSLHYFIKLLQKSYEKEAENYLDIFPF